MSVALTALLPVFFGLAVGYFSGKLHIVDNRHVDGLNNVVMRIALPITLFTVLASADRSDVIEHGAVVAAILIVLVAIYAFVIVLERYVWRGSLRETAVVALTVAFPNTAAVALPIAETVLGSTGQLAVALSLAVGSVTLTPLTLIVLGRTAHPPAAAAPAGAARGAPASGATDTAAPRASRTEISLWTVIGRSLMSPLVVAPVVGIAWSLFGIPFPSLLQSTLGEIGTLTAGLALFVTGLVLSTQSLKPSWNIALLAIVGNVVRPVLALAVARLFDLNATMTAETVLLLATPSGFFGVLLGLARGERSHTASGTLFYSTALSVLTLPLTIIALPLL